MGSVTHYDLLRTCTLDPPKIYSAKTTHLLRSTILRGLCSPLRKSFPVRPACKPRGVPSRSRRNPSATRKPSSEQGDRGRPAALCARAPRQRRTAAHAARRAGRRAARVRRRLGLR
eukprot:2667004-Prymnesium_polylepis.1